MEHNGVQHCITHFHILLFLVYHTLCIYGRDFFDTVLYLQRSEVMLIWQKHFIFDSFGAFLRGCFGLDPHA